MRAIVIGTSGTGKTTFARELARILDVPHTELDALFWGPQWTRRPPSQFLASVDAASAGERWVIDGNYSVARDLLWPRATHIIWLDYGRVRVFTQVLRRTLWRSLTRAPLWSGNRESLRTALFSRDSILVWSLTTFDKNRQRYSALQASGAFPAATWVRARHPRDAQAWMASVERASRSPA